jgi:hypothetical protein
VTVVVLVAAAHRTPEALSAVPAVLLVVALVAGWFPGASVLDRLRRTTRRPRRVRAPRSAGTIRRRSGPPSGGGALLGLHLAGNAPPAAALPAP